MLGNYTYAPRPHLQPSGYILYKPGGTLKAVCPRCGQICWPGKPRWPFERTWMMSTIEKWWFEHLFKCRLGVKPEEA